MTELHCNFANTCKDVWSKITLEDLVTAISCLGDRIDQLQDETW